MEKITSAGINSEIYNVGPAFFETVRTAVTELATRASTREVHLANKSKLNDAVSAVLKDAIPKALDHRQLWQVLWPRIVYAGTRSSKATPEITSMRSLVPIFTDLDNYVPGRYVFVEDEWKSFAESWKKQLSEAQKSKWISVAKGSRDWNPSAYFANAKTTPEVWKILVKDDAAYPGLKFSSKLDKVRKYLALAEFLYAHRDKGGTRPLDYYTAGYTFSPHYLTGEQWVKERQALDSVKKRLELQVGPLTALHTMMDLGLKTIKPDRVMTYLFSRLGWLQTLPASMDKDQVLDVYLDETVVQEMTIRADVLAASLAQAGYTQAHRLLDIWLVKFGQEPEAAFGITVNLQNEERGIQAILEDVKNKHVVNAITEADARRMWPTGEFAQLQVSKDKAKRRGRVRLPWSDVERLFTQQWRLGHQNQPHIYPGGKPGIPNREKDEILKKIERGIDPEEAFLSVLVPEVDD